MIELFLWSLDIRVRSNSVQGLSNLYDSVKEACYKNKTDIMQVKTSLKSANNDTKVIRKGKERKCFI